MNSLAATFLCVSAFAFVRFQTQQERKAQAAPETPSLLRPTILRSTTREVDVDVIVTDDKGQPVRGLTKDDFHIFEDNTPQTALSFEAHAAGAVPSSATAAPKLPVDTFTNFTPTGDSNPSIVILLDQLDTPIAYQSYAYQQAVDFVRHLPPAVNVAIFTLNARMALIQPFTGDAKVLLSALQGRRAKPQPSLLLGSTATLAIDLEGNNDNYRQQILADGMTTLGRYLAGFPGRKNLIWLTVDIPGNKGDRRSVGNANAPITGAEVAPLGTNGAVAGGGSQPVQGGGSGQTPGPNPLAATVSGADGEHIPFRNYNGGNDFARASGALALGRVAVYVLDSRGLMTPAEQAANPDYYFQQEAMDRVAEATGGRAFYNSNSLAQVMGEIVTDSSDDYRLTYSPTNKDWNGEFRHLQLKVTDRPRYPVTSTVTGKSPVGSLHLSYRPGYFAEADSKPEKDNTKGSADSEKFTLAEESQPQDQRSILLHRLPKESLQASMTLGQLPPTEIVFVAQVKAVEGAFQLGKGSRLPDNDFRREKFKYQPYRHFDVLFATDAHSLSLPRGAGGLHHGKIEFVTVVYNDAGDVVNSLITSASLDLREPSYQQMLRTGIGTHQSIAVPIKGAYTFRLGVRDALMNHVGALEIPIASIAKNDR